MEEELMEYLFVTDQVDEFLELKDEDEEEDDEEN